MHKKMYKRKEFGKYASYCLKFSKMIEKLKFKKLLKLAILNVSSAEEIIFQKLLKKTNKALSLSLFVVFSLKINLFVFMEFVY